MRKLLTALALAAGALVAVAAPAAAAQVAPGDEVEAPVLVIPAATLTLLTATVLPLVNGLLLRAVDSDRAKALVSNVVATIAYALVQAVADDGAGILTEAWFHGLLATLVVQLATYYGVWRPIVNPNATLPTLRPGQDRAA